MSVSVLLLILVVFFLWLCTLTVLFFRFYSYYSRIVKTGKKESIVQMLDDLLERQESNKKAIANIEKICEKLEKEGSLHIQKLGLLRFNPFKDTGGDQSFILALLDSHDTGVIISSLHTRTGTRWYAKAVKKGKGVEYELSDEEQKAVEEASVFLKKSI